MQEEIRFFFSPLIFSPNRRISAVYRWILSLKILHIRHWLLSSAEPAQNIAPAKPYTHIYQTNTERKKADHNYNQDQVQFLKIYKQNLNSEFILLSPEYTPESTLKLQAKSLKNTSLRQLKHQKSPHPSIQKVSVFMLYLPALNHHLISEVWKSISNFRKDPDLPVRHSSKHNNYVSHHNKFFSSLQDRSLPVLLNQSEKLS